jgi:hypothetical protein
MFMKWYKISMYSGNFVILSITIRFNIGEGNLTNEEITKVLNFGFWGLFETNYFSNFFLLRCFAFSNHLFEAQLNFYKLPNIFNLTLVDSNM